MQRQKTNDTERVIYLITRPISVNHLYGHRTVGRGRMRYITKEGKAFKNMIAIAWINKYPNTVLTGKVKVSVFLNWKDKRKRDIDNYFKATLDALKGVAYKDDDQIYELFAYKAIGCSEDNMTIIIKEMETGL